MPRLLIAKNHFEEPYESRGSRTVPRGAWGEIPLAYSTSGSLLVQSDSFRISVSIGPFLNFLLQK